jgi:hypothetical protein
MAEPLYRTASCCCCCYMLLQATQGGAPSRREAMFGLLGAGLGVGFTTAFFKGTRNMLRLACVAGSRRVLNALHDGCPVHDRSWWSSTCAWSNLVESLLTVWTCVMACHAMLCCAAAQYPDDDAALEEALDALLDNPDFLDLVADEVMFQVSRGGTGGRRWPGGGGVLNHKCMCGRWSMSEQGCRCSRSGSVLGADSNVCSPQGAAGYSRRSAWAQAQCTGVSVGVLHTGRSAQGAHMDSQSLPQGLIRCGCC